MQNKLTELKQQEKELTNAIALLEKLEAQHSVEEVGISLEHAREHLEGRLGDVEQEIFSITGE